MLAPLLHPAAFTASHRLSLRRTIIAVEVVLSISGLAGAIQLVTGTFTPPVSDLEPLGLSSWVLPGLWLFATVALPAGLAAWLAWRQSRWAPTVVLIGSLTLAVEVVVQIPFIGWSVLQAVFGGLAVVLAAMGLYAASHRT